MPTNIERLQEKAEIARKLAKQWRENKIARLHLYPKQLDFIALGGEFRERALFAANQTGKTTSICAEVAAHVTGLYPPWWPKTGKRFLHSVEFIIAGKTAISTRDVLQTRLIGSPGSISNIGTGLIPKHCIVLDSKVASHGVGGGIDFIEIKHASGGLSRLFFRTYAQGVDLFEGLTLTGGVVMDEEPGEDIYQEALTRISATAGFLAILFTPLKGRTAVVKRFLDQSSPDRAHVNMTLDDAGHFTAERKAQIKAGTAPWLYKPKILGIPAQGENAVFPIELETLQRTYPPLSEMPPYWSYLWGIDPGIGHPFAAVLIGYDRDHDAIHVLRCIRAKDWTPLQQAAAMKAVAENVRVAWPKDAGNRQASSGKALTHYYKEQGLDMLPDHCVNEDGSVGIEAGLIDIYQRMTTGRFFVNVELVQWFEEARDYHRDDNGNVVPIDDDIMSGTRYGCMMVKRKGVQGIPGRGKRRAVSNRELNTPEAIAQRTGSDDPFNERPQQSSGLGRNGLPEVGVYIRGGVTRIEGERKRAIGADDSPLDW